MALTSLTVKPLPTTVQSILVIDMTVLRVHTDRIARGRGS